MRQEGRQGQIVIIAIILLFFIFTLSLAISQTNMTVSRAENKVAKSRIANAAATAGLEKAVWCLNHASAQGDCGGTAGSGFTGENGVALPNSSYTTTVTNIDTVTKEIDVVGYLPSAANPVAVQHLKAKAVISSDSVAFNYALQTGVDGLNIWNNARINGNVYANGNVQGSYGATVTGDVWVAGGTQPVAEQSLVVNGDLVFGKTEAVADPAQSFTAAMNGALNSVNLYLKKTGSPSSKTVYILTDNSGKPSKTSLANTMLDTSQVTGSYGWVSVTFTNAPTLASGTKYWIAVDSWLDASNYLTWGKDTAAGYARGQAMTSANWNTGTPVWTAANADLAFKAYMGGVTTWLDNVVVGGDLHANTIKNCSVGGDAYFQTNQSCTVAGTSYPGSTDPGPAPFPVSDSMIDQWKAQATAGGVIAGDYQVVGGGTASLGPKKITGNLVVSNNATLTLTGTIYVQGNITLANDSLLKLDPSFGSSSGVLMNDGTIVLSNNGIMQNAGAGSFILVVSTATNCPSCPMAITLANNALGAIFYAPNGKIGVYNDARVTGLAGKQIELSNNATLVYETGMASMNFSSGPGGEWVIAPDSWREVK